MPLHLMPPTRRRFLQHTLVGGAALLAAPALKAAVPQAEASNWALLSDTHIDSNAATVARGANMFENLHRIIDEVLAEEIRPAGVIINGDCAYLKGLSADYATLSKALQRFTDADLPVHMTMGNHDDRAPFYQAFQQQRPENPLVEGKHVTMLATPQANLFLVDSLWKVNVVTGELGKQQLEWLLKALDAHPDKPAIVIGHHNLQVVPEGSTTRVSGLSDSRQLLEAMQARPHVQAYVFGHTHNWNVQRTESQLHLVNLPPCAYVFNASRPNGWVRATFGADQMSLELRALDKKHAQHAEKQELSYRALAVAQ